MTRRQSNRRGYALLLVMVFVVLFSAILGVAWRRVASAIRVEFLSEVRRQSDQGSIPVLAQAMKFLETRLRWDAANSVVKLNGSTDATISYSRTVGSNYYIIAFARTGMMDGTEWSVNVTVAKPEDILLLTPLPDSPP
jgi:type II secretory pathway component PulJ